MLQPKRGTRIPTYEDAYDLRELSRDLVWGSQRKAEARINVQH